MKKEELAKLIPQCNDEEYASLIRMAMNDIKINAVNKDFWKAGEDEIRAAVLDARRRIKYKTGWKKLDDVAMLKAGRLTIIPAYTHHGKSVFMLNLAWRLYKQYPDMCFIYYSFEMDLADVASAFARFWYYDKYEDENKTHEHVSLDEWERRIGIATDDMHGYFMKAVSEFSKRIFIRCDRISPVELDVHVRKLIDANDKVGVVFIDYLQDMKIERTGENHADIEQMALDVERVAIDYGVAVVAAAQYKRPEGYGKITKKSLCREDRIFGSSGLAKKADVIFSVYNDTMFNKQFNGIPITSMQEDIEIDVLKARKQGYASNLTFTFDRRTGVINESSRVVQKTNNDEQ